MAKKRPYGPENTEVAHRVMMEVLTALGTYVAKDQIVLIGGFVPHLLLKEFPRLADMPAHMGSSDVDLLLDFRAIDEKDYATIRKALRGAGFVQRTESGQDFMWDKVVSRKGSDIVVTVDLMAPESGGTGKKHRHQKVQDDLPLRKVDGGDLALAHTIQLKMSGRLLDGKMTTHRVRVASAAAMIAMKGLIVGNRRKEADPRKDAYDLYMLITYYKKGPESAADEVRPLRNHPIMKKALLNIRDKWETRESVGPMWAGEMAAGGLGSFAAGKIDDAFQQVREFLRLVDEGA